MMARKPRKSNDEELFARPRVGESVRPASAVEIAETEASLGVMLPESFKAVLRERNGGKLRRGLFDLKRKPPARSHASKKYQLSELHGVGDSERAIPAQTELARREWGLPAGLIPIRGEGHWWCCLDYRACGARGEPSITHFEDEAKIDFEVAPSFMALLAGLYRDPESATPALIALDDGAPRGEALGRALVTLGCRLFEPPGWTNPNYPMPPQWRWEKYRSCVEGVEACIEVWKNRHLPRSPLLTADRPERHPMLRVSVHAEDEDTCLAELLAGLGPGAVLIHGME
jgi:hypothetical protein